MATAVAPATHDFVRRCSAMVSDLVELPARSMWVDYDEEADVLYMSFRRPQRATKTVELDGDILVRTDGSEVVGVTVLNARARQ